MNTRVHKKSQRGSTLVTTLILASIALIAAGSLLGWTTTNQRLVGRNNEYYRAVAAAEAATEKVISRIAYDYRSGGEALNKTNLASYRTTIPTATENTAFGNFWFNDGTNNNKTCVDWLPPSQFKSLSGPYKGLMGYATSFRVASNAKDMTTRFKITAGVLQEVDVVTIPLFQFAIFYNLDLEINPGAPMTVTGPVHGNFDIYLNPAQPLTFEGDVTAAGNIIIGPKPGDCEDRVASSVSFGGKRDDTANQLNLPVGTNTDANTSAEVRQIVEPPPAGELPTSAAGKERFYNKADLVVKVTGTLTTPTYTVTSGLINNFGTTVSTTDAKKFLTNSSFVNKREGKTVRSIDIDIAKLKAWSETNTTVKPVVGGDISTVYIWDARFTNSSQSLTDEPGIRVKNGLELPARGLTIATPDPIYVWGDYNTQITVSGNVKKVNNHDTTYTRPAALIGDAITILSPDWDDPSSSGNLSSRKAKGAGTMINAAFMAGIIQTTNCNYSGGVENFPRFLEDWGNGTKITYNGSMVVMYESKWATGLWGGADVYVPPNRDWAFDTNFKDPSKLPPSTPAARTLARNGYAMTKPNTSVAAP